MVTVPASFRQQPRWWRDDAGRAWLEELPALVQAQCRRWRLVVDGPPRHGSNALVVPVRRDDLDLALRFSPPGDDVGIEARALRFWNGRGTVLLHDVDAARRAMLLERLDAGTSLASAPLAEAVGVLADLATTLAVPAPDDVPSTASIAGDLAASIEDDWGSLGSPAPRQHLEAVLRAASALAASDGPGLAVDGDLHFDQVLRGARAPWLVVDPVLLRGDVEYDLGRVLWSRLDEIADDVELRALFDLFVRRAGVPPERARSWVLVRAASYLVWGLQRGLTLDPPKCRRLLHAFG